MFENVIYLDNSASTRMDEQVLEAMKPYFFDTYAVATSEFGYSMGIDAKEALEKSRGSIASKIAANWDEVIFTSGSTESSNTALKGVAWALKEKKGKHIIVSKIEDFPVLNTAKALERQGFSVTFLDVDAEGFVNLEGLRNAITKETVLVSIQHGNQEIGTVQDLKAISEICEEKDVLLHTDATHSFTRLPLNVKELPVDLITMSAHTIHGPRGIGALYIRKDTPITKFMDGGFQEFNLRAGVEDIPSAVGFAKAVELVTEEENMRLKAMRDRIIDKALSDIPDVTLNGSREKRLPQNANLTFHYVEGESITLHMDMRGFAVSTGSACFSRSLEASHVIMGIGGDHERAHGSVRFTFGRYNRMEDVDAAIEAISEIVAKLREISPLAKK
ncbi:MAG: cysteine desulfurase family protein [Methanosarcina thermophila]|uniref:cysteine desulfurase family protein n=1 Tax=Methanosarcina thermophila TaxID=2210 RepID=UPI0009E2355C|nr:cysteine desulfurase family protein [Methanosarcina thermophila]NLU56151.1 cysteine desulfurase [Methanosarcina thermophila]HOA69900.1 cysteine desulfurase family protein [Methanosarcina thermophila]HOQ66649.1 cysteine desulfurase family protein [Methanosarcina thermophila]HPT81788.1 cysteine desulfurase family protein [Methanosarcina thermophila]HPZ21005.1 cysteine desulfurase family protein [Methanosarcina thermophila]